MLHILTDQTVQRRLKKCQFLEIKITFLPEPSLWAVPWLSWPSYLRTWEMTPGLPTTCKKSKTISEWVVRQLIASSTRRPWKPGKSQHPGEISWKSGLAMPSQEAQLLVHPNETDIFLWEWFYHLMWSPRGLNSFNQSSLTMRCQLGRNLWCFCHKSLAQPSSITWMTSKWHAY